MTLFELRQKGLTVGGERVCPGGGRKVLVRCGCLRWQWRRASPLVFKVKNGHAVRCDGCARALSKKAAAEAGK